MTLAAPVRLLIKSPMGRRDCIADLAQPTLTLLKMDRGHTLLTCDMYYKRSLSLLFQFCSGVCVCAQLFVVEVGMHVLNLCQKFFGLSSGGWLDISRNTDRHRPTGRKEVIRTRNWVGECQPVGIRTLTDTYDPMRD